jgi:hypothetical protein
MNFNEIFVKRRLSIALICRGLTIRPKVRTLFILDAPPKLNTTLDHSKKSSVNIFEHTVLRF